MSKRKKYIDTRARLESKRHITPEGHWLWTGHLNPLGYGFISIDGVNKAVHR